MMFEAALGALFVQVALTFVLLFMMAFSRTSSLRNGEVKFRDIALGEPNWDVESTKRANCFRNQFELPVLFYAAVLLALVLRKAELLFVVLAWLFVLTRIIHAVVQTTSNHVPRRAQVYFAGAIVLLLMWILLVVRVYLIP
jgi:hypothetical protein